MGHTTPEAAGELWQAVPWACQDLMDGYKVAQGKSWNFSGGEKFRELPFGRYQWVTFCCLSLLGGLPSIVACFYVINEC